MLGTICIRVRIVKVHGRGIKSLPVTPAFLHESYPN